MISPDSLDAIHNPARLETLRRPQLLDTPAEPAFHRLTRLAARFVSSPIVLMSLVDEERQNRLNGDIE
ncbi:MAG TPA: hypothetical protein VFU22_28210 [Roseiflexaceae bacterium]|nr:hypothetical protein [Roseiflexaceae bacterium]